MAMRFNHSERINKHIQIIAMIITVVRRIPADITIRLGKAAVTFAVSNAILFAFTDMLHLKMLLQRSSQPVS